MDSTRNGAMKTDNDLFVVRSRMADDQTRAATETLARAASHASNGAAGARIGAGPRVWLGRRLVEAGTALAGTALAGDRPASEPQTTTGQPC